MAPHHLDPTPTTSLYLALDQLLAVLSRAASGTAAQEALGWLVQGEHERARLLLDRLPDHQIEQHQAAAGELAELLAAQARRRGLPHRTPCAAAAGGRR